MNPDTNRQRNKIKRLYWEDNGFVFYYKSLAEEKFRWPRLGDEVMPLTGQEINWLLDGYDISRMKGHKKLHYEALFYRLDNTVLVYFPPLPQ